MDDLHNRRASDRMTEEERELDASFQMCPVYLQHADMMKLQSDVHDIKKSLEKMVEMYESYNDAKAFFRVVKVIGEVMKWVVAVGAAIGIIWYFVTGRKNG